MITRFIAQLTLVAFLFSSCSHHMVTTDRQELNSKDINPDNTAQEETPLAPNQLAPGYLLRLSSLEDKNLNGSYRIGFDGKLILPYRVLINTKGKKVEQLKAEVGQAYKKYFHGNEGVQIDVSEKEFWVDIRGLATKPGRYLVKQDTSLDEVIAKGGGFPKDTPAKFVKITSDLNTKVIDLDAYYRTGEPSHLPTWQGGERIFFQTEEGQQEANAGGKNTLRILGEVKRPGDISYRPGADFLYYLSEAGGPTQNMNPAKIQIYRSNSKISPVEEFTIDKTNTFPSLRKGDTVLVYADRPSPFEKFIQSSAGIASIISALALVIIAGKK